MLSQDAGRREDMNIKDQLREIIMSIDTDMCETGKWNAPSFALHGIDVATITARPGKDVLLVLHYGARSARTWSDRSRLQDTDSLLAWRSDDRAIITVPSSAWIEAHQAALRDVLHQWFGLVHNDAG